MADDFSDILNGAGGPDPGGAPPEPAADSAPSAAPAAAAQKVELDLDDAPFLVPDEPEEPAQAAPQEEKKEEEDSDDTPVAARPWFKSPIVLGGMGGIVLAVVALVVVLALSGPSEPPRPDPIIVMEESAPPLPTTPTVVEEPDVPQRFQVNFAPFLVIIDGPEGKRILTLKFTVFAEGVQANYDMQEKEVLLRNTVYDFLRAQQADVLTTPSAANVLKNELRTVLSGVLPGGGVGEVLIEQLLVQ